MRDFVLKVFACAAVVALPSGAGADPCRLELNALETALQEEGRSDVISTEGKPPAAEPREDTQTDRDGDGGKE